MLLPDGEYDFEVSEAKDKTSNAGNEMIALTLKVWDINGKEFYVRDWLMEQNPRAKMKMLRFCQTTGITESYDAGSIDQNVCFALAGRVLIGHQDSPDFGPQNRVIDYLPTVDQISQDIPAEYAEKPPLLGVPAAQTNAARQAADEQTRANIAAGVDDDGVPF